MEINMDAFSDGQIKSKLILLNSLINYLTGLGYNRIYNTFVLAGWYGILPFLMLSQSMLEHSPIKFHTIHNFDIDDKCGDIGEKINNSWFYNNPGYHYHHNIMNINNIEEEYKHYLPTVVINTSTEHVKGNKWFDIIPSGTVVALQSTNMKHAEHINLCDSEQHLSMKYRLSMIDTLHTQHFKYANNFEFDRYTLIGIK